MVETRPERKVIVIPAREKTPEEQERKKNLRVAAYCRVSTNSEEQLSSYENQLAYYTEKIMKNPEWTMMEVFADEGITGTSTSKRKNFLRMIRQCRQGKIDLPLCKEYRGHAQLYPRAAESWYPGHLRGAWPQLHLPGKRVPHHHLRRAGAGGERVHILPCQVGRSAVHAGRQGQHPV